MKSRDSSGKRGNMKIFLCKRGNMKNFSVNGEMKSKRGK
jgi:hypothetical protein